MILCGKDVSFQEVFLCKRNTMADKNQVLFFFQGRSAQKMMVGKESFPSEAKTATFQGENLLFHLRDSLTSIEALRKAVLG